MTFRTAIALVFAASYAAAGAIASFDRPQNYPNIGLVFPLLSRAKAEPLPMPLAHTYVLVGDDDSLMRDDRFDPFELWYADQCCARWADSQGNRLVLGRISRQLPSFDADFVSRDHFLSALADDANLVDAQKEEEIDDWVATFVDFSVYKPEKVKANAFNLDGLLFYPCDATNTLVYAFRPRRGGSASNPSWYCAVFRSATAADNATLRRFFEEQFLDRVETPKRSSADEGAESKEVSALGRDEAKVEYPGQPVRAAARKSIENYESWWFAETEDYLFLADVETDVGKALIAELKVQLPALRKAYARLLPPLCHDSDVSLVRVFQKREDYVSYVGAGQAWTAGVWVPGRRELVLAATGTKDELIRVIRHESFHQYLSYAYCMVPAPVWLNEGHACFFENASADKKGKVTIAEDPTYGPLLLDNLEAATAQIPNLINADYPGFYGGTDADRNFKYALAWSVAYYLQKGAPQERNTPFKSILPTLAATLARTRSYQQATQDAFSKVDMSVFQENFREFWTKRRASAMQFDPLDD